MTTLTLDNAAMIADAALAAGGEHGFAPLAIVVLDAGGHDLVVKRSEAANFYRTEIARTKAYGCLGMGMGGRDLAKRAKGVPAFYAALATVTSGGLLPMPGGVLIRDSDGAIIGAVGVSGDTGDNDEIAALAGIEAAGLVADPGKSE
jgi:uncharacterized protein GlcG (DUF336 family)